MLRRNQPWRCATPCVVAGESRRPHLVHHLCGTAQPPETTECHIFWLALVHCDLHHARCATTAETAPSRCQHLRPATAIAAGDPRTSWDHDVVHVHDYMCETRLSLSSSGQRHVHPAGALLAVSNRFGTLLTKQQERHGMNLHITSTW